MNMFKGNIKRPRFSIDKNIFFCSSFFGMDEREAAQKSLFRAENWKYLIVFVIHEKYRTKNQPTNKKKREEQRQLNTAKKWNRIKKN